MKMLKASEIPTTGDRSEIDGDALREQGATVLLVVRLAGREIVWDIAIEDIDREPLREDREQGAEALALDLARTIVSEEMTAELRVFVGDGEGV